MRMASYKYNEEEGPPPLLLGCVGLEVGVTDEAVGGVVVVEDMEGRQKNGVQVQLK
jgi:hypothetical protein